MLPLELRICVSLSVAHPKTRLKNTLVKEFGGNAEAVTVALNRLGEAQLVSNRWGHIGLTISGIKSCIAALAANAGIPVIVEDNAP